jgi:hypothetical protein
MTATEYAIAYRHARATLPNITIKTMRELKKTYIEAAKLAAAQVAKAELAGYGELTMTSWAQIESALLAGAREIQRNLDEAIPLAAKDIAGNVTQIDETYLTQAIRRAGVGLDLVKVRNLFVDASDKVVRSLVNRIWSDGYSFSARVWRTAGAYQDAMKRVITAGIGSGRDVVKVAKDLEVYVQRGKAGLATRWGDLVGADFQRRVRGSVDYNALRLVRSELYMSLQDAAKLDGQINPACTGMYDWKRTNATDWGCDCPDLEAGSPYSEDQLPDYPHANCMCLVTPRLMDGNEFIADLKAWSNGADVGYLDEWNREFYQKAAA